MVIAFALFCMVVTNVPASNAQQVSFSRDVLPVLSDRCFHCHGPDEENREAGLRLDVESAAKEDLGGYAAITPNDLEASEIWNRITSDDEYEVMPPPDSHRKPLSEHERQAVRQWIEQGAPWGKHWSFEPIQRPSLPKLNATKSSSSRTETANKSTHPIDSFVIARLADENRTLSPPADSITQLRRLAFDLTGMSPTPEQIKRYQTRLRDGDPTAWTQAIEEMLESPHHAERMAMWWLDAARYSDSDGFQQDATRENWPWRDWVIEQFVQNRPFDEFTIEQFAGDLLPDATPEQKLATCFHRNHMTNGEGGRDPEESRIDYVIDRVNTTGTVWLGLTLGCVQCHTHKFDPITHHDYYSLSAFFNSIDEDGRAGMNAKPYLEYESPKAKQQSDAFAAFVKECEQFESAEKERAIQRFDAWLNEFQTSQPNEHVVWHTPQPTVSGVEGTQFQVEDDQIVQTTGPKTMHDDYRIVLSLPDDVPRVTGIRLEVFPHESHVDGRFSRDGNGEFTLTNVLTMGRREGSPSETQIDLVRATADVEADKKRETKWDTRYSHIKETLNDDARDGWTTEGVEKIEPHVGVYQLDSPWEAKPGDQFIVLLRHRSTHGHANIGRFRISLTSEYGETVHRVDGGSPLKELVEFLQQQNLPSETENSDASDAEPNSLAQLDDQLRKRLLDQYLVSDEAYQQASQRLSRARKQQKDLERQSKSRRVMVLSEREKARDTHVLVRGVWDAKGDVVQRAVLPSVLPRPPEETQTRLDLANWIVDRENPLTARVIANHLWQLMFGNGLVRTPGDFGLQGELPTHPKLLDWLAVELLDNDWDLNHVIRLIATSQTYRQSSVATPEMLQWDPENRMLARAPRFRLPAWMIRDNALRVSGLLTPTIGGPPVLPYQPDGVWAEITMGRFDYQPSVGPPQYRRTLYAFWRRSSAPTFLFDSAQRRVCEVGVRRTNTPLHALTLMNDTTMLEASRALADEAVAADDKSKSKSDTTKIAWTEQANAIAMRVLSRELSQDELVSLQSVWDRALAYYDKHPESAVSYCTVGQRPPPTLEHAPPTAAWQTTASLLLNLDEAMTRE
ncbi:PSD1 and planctomycete cytochrome C domain-containing protein [Rhodopirellula sp. JC740]|uniref:PSD1 and planctomycete cytochrome C domain-containing protein n=1 Tax=Rhodopirellula halodulae TaxID=2894198 RepID=A0ABS8NDU4_9BACT|nr:PSD1 and planctomycete cytochrome C domain-containing protein [Rhodopirellula sp. JC740]MCC9640993.1 PSD1 and planctomycete cytochrome C domain-containing protein [Rhodopirellula sp. JC740]